MQGKSSVHKHRKIRVPSFPSIKIANATSTTPSPMYFSLSSPMSRVTSMRRIVLFPSSLSWTATVVQLLIHYASSSPTSLSNSGGLSAALKLLLVIGLLAYVPQLENSRLRLTQLEQELQRARQQGIFIASGLSGDHGHSVTGNGALAFDMDYTCWLDEHQRLINDLRLAVNSYMGDNELHILVEGVMAHYDEVFRLKSSGAKAYVFHMLSGMWKTPTERCLMWLGGFHSSELLKILGNHIEPLTDQQLMGICNLQQSSQQAEDALSQGMEALQQSLVDTLSSACLGPTGSGNVADYMGQMEIAMGNLATLENFLGF
ncbi:hypothetical protein REPUB_Repub17cG0033800 [Reevesia pubescens]